MTEPTKIYMTPELSTLVAMAREGEWLCAEASVYRLDDFYQCRLLALSSSKS